MSTTSPIPTFLLPDATPPHTNSPPSKLASRYRPTPLPSPNHSSYGQEGEADQARPSSPPPPSPPHSEQPHSRAEGPPQPSPDPRPPTPSPPSKESPAAVPLIVETTFNDNVSVSSPPDQTTQRTLYIDTRSESYLSTSSSFSSGGSPLLQSLVDPTPLSEPFVHDEADNETEHPQEDQLERPTVTRAKRSYSNKMVEVALAALEGLMLEQRRGTSSDEEREKTGEEDLMEERRTRGMGGEGVKSVWREVGVWE